MPREAVYRWDQTELVCNFDEYEKEALMKRFGIAMGGIAMIALLLASSGCYVGYHRGYDHQGSYRGYDRNYDRYDRGYDRYDNRYRRW
jgi:hypothetical protein